MVERFIDARLSEGQSAVGRVDLELGGARIESIEVRGEHGAAASIESVEARFALRDLIRGPKRVRFLGVTGLTVAGPILESLPDGATESADPAPATTLLVDTLHVGVRDLSNLYEGLPLEAGPLDLAAEGLALGGSTTLQAGRAEATLRRFSSVATPLFGLARVSLGEGLWRLESVVVSDSTGASVSVTGTIRPWDEVDLEVVGADLRPGGLYPPLGTVLSGDLRARLEASVTGPARSPNIVGALDLGPRGHVELDGHVLREDDAASLVLAATPSDLDLRGVLRGRAPTGLFSGRIDVRVGLSGAAAGEGEVAVELTADAEESSLTGRMDFAAGITSMSLHAGWPGGAALMEGTLSTAEGPATYRVRVEGDATPTLPSRLGAAFGWAAGPWSVSAEATGEGLGPGASVVGSARARNQGLDPSGMGPVADASFLVEDGALRAHGSLVVDSGSVGASATARLADLLGTWSVDSVVWEGLPWTAAGTGRPRARSWGRATLDATDGGFTGSVTVDSLTGFPETAHGRLSLTSREGRIDLEGRASAGDGVVELSRATLLRGRPVEVRGSFLDVDPSRWASTLPAARLTGDVSMAADTIHLTLGEATLGGEPAEGRLTVRSLGDGLAVDASFSSSGESISWVGTVLTSPATVTIQDASFVDVEPSRWFGSRMPSGYVTGRLSGTAALDAEAMAEIRLDSARLAGVPASNVAMTVRMVGDSVVLRVSGDVAGHAAAVVAQGDRQLEGRWAGTAMGSLVRTAHQLECASCTTDTLRLRGDLARAGDGGDWSTRISAEGRVLSTRVDSLSAVVAARGGVLRLDRLDVEGPEIRLSGVGEMGLDRPDSTSLRLAGTIEDVAPILVALGREGMGGRAGFTLSALGSGGDVRSELDAWAADARLAGIQADSLHVRADGASTSGLVPQRIDAVATAAGIGGFRLHLGEGPLSMGLGGTEAPSVLSISGNWSSDRSGEIHVRELTAGINDATWTTDAGFVVDAQERSVGPMVFTGPTGQVRLSGQGEAPARWESFRMETDNLPVQLFMERRSLWRGTLSSVLAAGSRAGEREIAAQARLSGNAAVGAGFTDLEARWDPRGLDVRVDSEPAGGGSVTVRGYLPLPSGPPSAQPTPLMPMDVRLEVDDIDISAPMTALGGEAFQRAQGRLTSHIAMTGSLDDPIISGDVTLRDGTLIPAVGPPALRFETLRVAMDGREARFSDATLADGSGGSARLEGGVRWREGTPASLDVVTTLESFAVLNRTDMQAAASGQVALEGDLARPVVRGNVTLDRGEYRLPLSTVSSAVEEIELTDADYEELERRFGLVPPSDGPESTAWRELDLDLSLSAPSNLWVRRAFEPALSAELEGSVRLTKRPRADLVMEGQLRVMPGRSTLEQFGRRFEISRGTIDFSGRPSDFELDARGTYAAEDADIWIDVQRGASGLTFVLGSDPAMDPSDVASVLASGRRATDVDRFGGEGLDAAGAGAGLALSRVTSGVEELTREGLGLDVVEIQQDGLNGLTLAAGRFVSPRLFVGFQQPVAFSARNGRTGMDQTELNAEYRLSEWLVANLTGARGLVRLFLGVERAF